SLVDRDPEAREAQRLIQPSSSMRGSDHSLFNQFHLFTGHEFFDIDQYQHAIVDGTDAGQVFSGESSTESGGRTELPGLQHQDIRDAIHHNAHDTRSNVQNDHHGFVIVFHRVQVK